MNLPVILGDEPFNFFFPLHQDGQSRCLNPTHRGQVKSTSLGVKRGHGARAIDSHQPVGFRTAYRGVRQGLHGFTRPQGIKPFPYRRGSHGLKPQALDGLWGSRMLHDITKNQFPFPAGVAGINQCIDILPLD